MEMILMSQENTYLENKDSYVSAGEFAKLVGVSKQTVINYHKKGIFQGIVVNGDYFFEKDRMYEFIKVCNANIRKRLEDTTRFIFICKDNEEVRRYEETLTKHMEKRGAIHEDNLEEVIEDLLTKDWADEGSFMVSYNTIDEKAKTEKERELSKFSLELQEKIENSKIFIAESYDNILLLIKHIMAKNEDGFRVVVDKQKITCEEVSEYLISHGREEFDVETVSTLAQYIGALLLGYYKQDCLNKLAKKKEELEISYTRTSNNECGKGYKRIFDEYIETHKNKWNFTSGINSKLKKGVYSMEHIVLGDTDAEILDKIYNLVLNYKNVHIFGSEYLSDDVKKFLKYFEKDGTEITLWESKAFDINYSE